MDPCTKTRVDDPCEEGDGMLYRQLVGSLLYFCDTRPDLSYTMNVLSHFMMNPKKVNWRVGKSFPFYLRGTISYGLEYEINKDVCLHGYIDADWFGDVNSRKSTTCYCFSLGSRMVSWTNKK